MHNLYLISIILIINTSLSATFFDTVYTFFGKTPYESTIQAVYPLAPNGLLTIINIDGNIHIKSDPEASNITIYATKHTSAKQHLEHIDIIQEEINDNNIMLRTSFGDHNVKGYLDYTITVPQKIHLALTTQKGSISIKDVAGAITAKTEHGNIHIHDAQSNIQASVFKQGSITVIGAAQELNLSTIKGEIQVLQSASTVSATTLQGNITITCKKLAELEEIFCYSLQGNISLYLPNTITAQLDAQTDHGTITSKRPVCIDSITTPIDKTYWQQVKRELRGRIGNGAPATIRLTTQKGNIILHES